MRADAGSLSDILSHSSRSLAGICLLVICTAWIWTAESFKVQGRALWIFQSLFACVRARIALLFCCRPQSHSSRWCSAMSHLCSGIYYILLLLPASETCFSSLSSPFRLRTLVAISPKKKGGCAIKMEMACYGTYIFLIDTYIYVNIYNNIINIYIYMRQMCPEANHHILNYSFLLKFK